MAGATVAGLPHDARACAWCGGQRVRLEWGHWICPYGCAEAEHAPFGGFCEDCRAEYSTGNPNRRQQCEACFQRERARLIAMHAGPEQAATGYTYRMRKDGTNRHVMAHLRDEGE